VRNTHRKYLEWIFYVVCPNGLRRKSMSATNCVRTGLGQDFQEVTNSLRVQMS
jgi:hypothetical protein